ncbi:MAG: bifunctional nuclease family protein [Dehalococcoidales bacterium]|jgi:bifunctional DNase/RNase|nr:bifunctional nuclease family protein [Dehalococcoidales bacterium]MDX9986149.1 bifunctional nuclease family protein [Dehalococcoidales bacterium]NLE89381.1 bifunctional nuclease family protein [Dehalococcoidales bacterium]
MIEVTIDSVRIGLMNQKPEYQYVVLLKEQSSKRYLPIFIGQNEARAILMRLKNEPVPRPMTHDLLQSIIENLGGKVDSIAITSLEGDVFFAKIMLTINGQKHEVDSRPSDALALALRVDARIYVNESVMDKTAITMEKDADSDEFILDQADQIEPEGKGGTMTEEEKKRLGVFRDFIDNLDMDGLDSK